jgi:Tol biopolymer transport system component
VAFFDHPELGDNLGSLKIVEESGRSRVLVAQGVSSFAWEPGGKELWITTFDRGGAADLSRVSLDGTIRSVTNLTGYYQVQDVSRDGKLLLQRFEPRREIVALRDGELRERNLTWFNWSYPCDISADGELVLFEEQNVGPRYQLYSRKTDGSDAVRLGESRCLCISPDGRWVLTVDQARDQLVLLPTGPGEPKALPKSSIKYSPWANFFPDGKRIVTVGSEQGRGIRLFVQDLDGLPRAIGPEGINIGRWKGLSPDGTRIAAIGPDRKVLLYPVSSGEPRVVPGVEPDEFPIRWSADGRGLYVCRNSGLPIQVFLVDVETGRRRLWKILEPPDPAGVLSVGPVFITPDGRSYVYSYRRELGELYLVEGLP